MNNIHISIRAIASSAIILLATASCSKSAASGGQEDIVKADPVSGIRIAWDGSSEQKIAQNGVYARVIRTDGGYMAGFENDGCVFVSSSEDGTQWSERRTVFARKIENGITVNAANAELVSLSDGTILCATNYRPTGDGAHWSVGVSRSTDGGTTWSDPQVVYNADIHASEGCWEPSFLELPDGTVHIYFANEYPYKDSGDQEISMLESSDKGVTWSTEPKTVSYRKGYRDGMPVAGIFGDKIVVAIEDNGVLGNGSFRPSTVRTSLNDPWKTPVLADSPDRDIALDDDIPASASCGAPYLLHLQGGGSLLSYQTTEGRDWDHGTMVVAIGDDEAKHFTKRTNPFYVPVGKYCHWNSLMQFDDSTVLAVGTTDKDGTESVWMKKGHVLREFKADSDVRKMRFFVGSLSTPNLAAGLGVDGGRLKMSLNVTDSGIAYTSGIYVFLDTRDENYAHPYSGTFKVWLSADGKEVKVWEGNDGTWKQTKSSYVSATRTKTDAGYSYDVEFSGKFCSKWLGSSIRVCYTFIDSHKRSETLVLADDLCPATWMRVTLAD